jgi:heme/copper-type cytochrome/quinol oxidase subunit 2
MKHQGKVTEKGDQVVIDVAGSKVTVAAGDVAKIEYSWAGCDYCLGIFDIACAELCGLGHYKMKGYLTVEPRASYEEWLKDTTQYESSPVWKLWRK